jgi:hypothetical protein
MKLTHIALAAVMAATGAANAATIDNGAGGNGGLFVNFFDGSTSYVLNLGYTIDSFTTKVAEAGALDLSWAADSNFTSFLAGANAATLKFNVWATEKVGPGRILNTIASAVPAAKVTNDILRTEAGNLTTYLNNVNLNLAASDSYITTTNTANTYGGKGAPGAVQGTGNNLLNYNNAALYGTNVSYDTGVGFQRIDFASTGTAQSTYTAFTDEGSAVRVYLDSGNTLHIAAAVAAVPEPETLAMLLAGLGLVGSIARRRMKNAA